MNMIDQMVAARLAEQNGTQQARADAPNVTLAEQIETLHDRLVEKNADYKALIALVDERIEYVTSTISESPRTIEQYLSLAGELRGLRAARGATTKRGRA